MTDSMKLDELQISGLELRGGEQCGPVHRFKQLMVGGVATPPAQLEILDWFLRVPTVDFRDTCDDQITTTEADAAIGRPSNRAQAGRPHRRFLQTFLGTHRRPFTSSIGKNVSDFHAAAHNETRTYRLNSKAQRGD